MGQGGNVGELQESAYDGVNNSATENRLIRGGFWSYPDDKFLKSSARYIDWLAVNEADVIGFRVASVIPEPSTYALIGFGVVALLIVSRKKAAKTS
jgi:hypothetical protein